MAKNPQPAPGPITAAAKETIAAIADGGMGVVITPISEGVVEKTVTVNGETFTMTLSQGTEPVI